MENLLHWFNVSILKSLRQSCDAWLELIIWSIKMLFACKKKVSIQHHRKCKLFIWRLLIKLNWKAPTDKATPLLFKNSKTTRRCPGNNCPSEPSFLLIAPVDYYPDVVDFIIVYDCRIAYMSYFTPANGSCTASLRTSRWGRAFHQCSLSTSHFTACPHVNSLSYMFKV